MKSWLLLFISDNQYYKFTMKTIQEARTIGCWTRDIVVCIPEKDKSEEWFLRAEQWGFELRYLPHKDFSSIQNAWKYAPESYEKGYLEEKKNIWNKFFIFDVYFKQWDVVFYLDSGCIIQDSLERFILNCEPEGCLYAHSNCYPSYEWKLKGEFVYSLMSEKNQLSLQENYRLDCDYFQSTIMIYDTSLIGEKTVDTLFEFAEKYICRGDQGIVNLYFYPKWKQIPLQDNQGWLYDFHERDGNPQEYYCILKYPLKNMI